MEVVKLNTNKEWLHLSKAIFFAACMPALIISPLSFDFSSYQWTLILFISAVVFLISLIHLVVLGLPIYFYLKKRSLLSWFNFIASGFMAACLLPFVIAFTTYFKGGGFQFMMLVVSCIMMGTLGAISSATALYVMQEKPAKAGGQ